MFAVYRQEFGSPLLHCASHQFSGSDKNLFVRQSDAFSRPDRLVGCNQPCGSMRG